MPINLLKTSIKNTPIYNFYGEKHDELFPDYLHFEHLNERSSKHNWTIKPHRHDKLTQIFYFRQGNVEILLGNEQTISSGPLLLFVPPMTTHGFHFSPSIKGGVLTIESSHVLQWMDKINIPERFYEMPIAIHENDAAFKKLAGKFDEIAAAFVSVNIYRNAILENEFGGLFLGITQAFHSKLESANPEAVPKQDKYIRDFCVLIEANYKTTKPIDFYADEIGISNVQLTRLCREILNRSPNEAIAARKILEAKRLLLFTHLAVKEIAAQLGFADMGYFSRFFKNRTGSSPKQYRCANKDHSVAKL